MKWAVQLIIIYRFPNYNTYTKLVTIKKRECNDNGTNLVDNHNEINHRIENKYREHSKRLL